MLRLDDLSTLIDTDRQDVLSVCLDTDPTKPENQATKPAYRIWARQTIRQLLDGLPSQRRKAAQEAADRILARVEGERPRGRGLAFYAAPDFWREFALPVPLANRVSYGRPDVVPILWALDEYEPYAILAVDREHARIFTAFLGRSAIVEEDSLELDTSDWRFKAGRPPTFTQRFGTGATRGSERDTFEARIDDHIRRFWMGVAEGTARVLQERGIRRLVIGGPEEAAKAVRDLLPPPAQAKVVAVVPVPAHASPAAVTERTLPVALDEERRQDERLVAEVLDGAAARTGAVVGLAGTIEALTQGQVEVVVADRNVDGRVYRCRACGHVVANATETCPVCGGSVEAAPLAQLLPLLVRRSGATLELVGGDAAARLRAHDGIAARLRFAPRPAAVREG